MGLGKNLLNALYDRKMSQTQLAEAIGTTQTAVCYYISGKRTPSLEICVKIADVLGCTVDELVREHAAEVK